MKDISVKLSNKRDRVDFGDQARDYLLDAKINDEIVRAKTKETELQQSVSSKSSVSVSNEGTTSDEVSYITIDGVEKKLAGGGVQEVSWGDIGGTLSEQTDLANALNSKVDLTSEQAITGVKTFSDTAYFGSGRNKYIATSPNEGKLCIGSYGGHITVETNDLSPYMNNTINLGRDDGTNAYRWKNIYFAGELNANGSAGTSGQVLTSNGSGAAPTWQDASGGSEVKEITITTSGQRSIYMGGTVPDGATDCTAVGNYKIINNASDSSSELLIYYKTGDFRNFTVYSGQSCYLEVIESNQPKNNIYYHIWSFKKYNVNSPATPSMLQGKTAVDGSNGVAEGGSVYNLISYVNNNNSSIDQKSYSIYVPTSAGEVGQVLYGGGAYSEPVWKYGYRTVKLTISNYVLIAEVKGIKTLPSYTSGTVSIGEFIDYAFGLCNYKGNIRFIGAWNRTEPNAHAYDVKLFHSTGQYASTTEVLIIQEWDDTNSTITNTKIPLNTRFSAAIEWFD